MIQETIVITQNLQGAVNLAPMGIHLRGSDEIAILPFRPAVTLDNLLATQTAVVNYCDDVRVFAGCLTGRYHWSLEPAQLIQGWVLQNTLAHSEVQLIATEDDPQRPKLICKILHTVNHRPFKGFNRAQFAVLEAAILISRMAWLPLHKIQAELDYLRIALEKTAGPYELEAWGWLMEKIAPHQSV